MLGVEPQNMPKGIHPNDPEQGLNPSFAST